MSEVLSGQDRLHASEGPHQSLRVRRLLMAAGTSLLVCLALGVCALLGLLPAKVSLQATAGIVTIVAIFYLVFRTGFNLRFADPSLTSQQVAAAIVFLAYIMYHAHELRSALTVFYLVAMLFGVLRLTVVRLMALALLALLSHGLVLLLQHLEDTSLDAGAALAELVVLAIVLPWFAAMGGYVNRLRVRLGDTNRELRTAFGRIEELAIRDELTGTFNRRYLMEYLTRERSRSQRLGSPLSVCLLDVDHFKQVNDRLGHMAGDRVLKDVAAVGAGCLRGVDVFGRYGGEEFLVLLPDTDRQGAVVVAERIRAAVESKTTVTLTIGVAQHAGEDLPALLASADRALYRGKAAGRNRVV